MSPTGIGIAPRCIGQGSGRRGPCDALVVIAPERRGRTIQSAATSVVVASLLWLGVHSGLDAESPDAAVSLLLAGAALYSA